MSRKQVIRLNESQLRQIVKESVKRVLREDNTLGKQVSSERLYHFYTDPIWEEYQKTVDRLVFMGLVPTFSNEQYDVDYFEDGRYGAHLVPAEHYTGQYHYKGNEMIDYYVHLDPNKDDFILNTDY